MLRRTNRPAPRSGAAAVEFAVVMSLVMVPLLIGVWEMGRVVYVQQLVANSAREGARLASQATTINYTGDPTQIKTAIQSNPTYQPNVKMMVYQTLIASGLTNLQWDDVTVSFAFLDQPTLPDGSTAPYGPNTPNPDPWMGVKNQQFSVTVTIPYAKVRWTSLGIVNPTTITYTAQWRILVDDPFQVDVNVPSW